MRGLPTLLLFVLLELLAPAAAKDGLCDLTTDGAICLFNGRKVLLPDAVPKGLIGHWTFDDMAVVDSSGKGNHAKNPIPVGPGVGNRGNSGAFNGFDYVEVPYGPDLTPWPTYTVTFWVYLLRSSKTADKWCPLVHKGDDSASSFSVQMKSNTRELRFISSTSQLATAEQPTVLSSAKLATMRWTHIAVTRSGDSLSLFVNGIEDKKSNSAAVLNRELPLYLGGVPWERDNCRVEMYMDEVRLYDRNVAIDEIQAEAAPALGGIQPSSYQLGCKECSLQAASTKCSAGFHLCTAAELHTGGYMIVRIMGWGDWKTHVWSFGDSRVMFEAGASTARRLLAASTALPSSGLGLCCTDEW